MAHLTLDEQLFEKQQNGEQTDISFVFKIKTEEGTETEKVIHGHKIILSSASKYFEINFKAEWNDNSPICINSCEWTVFEKLIRAIYLSEVTFETLEEAMDIYEAAHFFQMERVQELLRDAIPSWCLKSKIVEISSLVKTAWKYKDYKLMPFVTKYFCANTQKIIGNEDFMVISPEVINWLFQYEYLSANEIDIVKAVEKYLEAHESVSKLMIKPAIDTIRFLALKDEEIAKTTLLTQTEKDFLVGKINMNTTNLTKNKIGRKVKSFFSQMPSEIQRELIEKVSHEKCWVCKQYHSVFGCKIAKVKYPMYTPIYSWTYANGVHTSKFDQIPAQNIINILKELQNVSASSDFAAFANVDELLRNSYFF